MNRDTNELPAVIAELEENMMVVESQQCVEFEQTMTYTNRDTVIDCYKPEQLPRCYWMRYLPQ